MGSIKTILSSLVLSAAVAPIGPAALSQSLITSDPLQFFATCAGRLSAEMEFQWMFDGAAADRISQERLAVLDIIDAMMPPDQGRTVLNWRVEAKMAQAALLTQATFATQDRRADNARTLALRNVESCRAQLLS
ncbi:hypothetical protein [Shimia sp.]|uniref:hypothetical protein n=1 Tax=Shimia sp. TaxID=1954381 RepID=UPI003297C6DE